MFSTRNGYTIFEVFLSKGCAIIGHLISIAESLTSLVTMWFNWGPCWYFNWVVFYNRALVKRRRDRVNGGE